MKKAISFCIGYAANHRRGKKAAPGSQPQMEFRQHLLKGLLCVCFGILVVALGYYQILNKDWWTQKAVEQQLRDTPVPAKRGTIYDASMGVLVESSTAWTVSLRSDNIKDEQKDAISAKLVEILGLTPEYLEFRMHMTELEEIKKNGKMGKVHPEVRLKGKYSMEQRGLLKDFFDARDERGNRMFPGVEINEDSDRCYHQGTLLSSVLGYVGFDNDGKAGLELQYDSVLSGTPGRVVEARNAREESMPFEYGWRKNAEDGNSLVLTVDAAAQAILEKYLQKAVVDNNVRNKACGIIMNVNTGAILAMANYPDYDPANYNKIVDKKTRDMIDSIIGEGEKEKAETKAMLEQSKNKAISDTYEPGSVFKPVTMAAALENGNTAPGDGFYCPGYMMIGKIRKNCHKAGGHGQQSLEQGMMNSCNPVFMTLAQRMGAATFFKYYSAFGLEEKTGVDLPGEEKGINFPSVYGDISKVKAIDLANSGFGQSNSVTPIQMITAISAVVNGGYLVTPHIVSQILDSDGNIVQNIEPRVRRQVISAKTSQIVTDMLEQTVNGGTAKNAYVKGYRIGGKTGTSEKLSETQKLGFNVYIASFCAVAPCDKPKIAMLILLDDPRGANHMGGTIAAPVARNVLAEVLPLPQLGVDTIYTTEDLMNIDLLIPETVGLPVAEAKAALEQKGLKSRVVGSGETVVDQIPRGSIPKGSTVVLLTDPQGAVPMNTVPGLRGMSPSQVNSVVVNAGFNVRFSGSGYDSTMGQAISQDPP
ncbi:MAG: penicillin-binding transpeptidase domain-containing protein, partial [Oscillospiraceae bacterium]|nr:penicillin-binding transpeptidase domain-containing protein [Oscillospiraceae bacterium]